MPDTSFRPRSGRYGSHPAFIKHTAGASPLTANTTTTIRCGQFHRRAWVERISVSCSTIAADADGTILATVYKRDVAAGADVALTAALSLESDGIATANKSVAFTMASGLTTAQRTLQEGDTLMVKVVNNSAAIDTQPADLAFAFEILVRE